MTHIAPDTEIGEFLIDGEKEILKRFVEIFTAHFDKHYVGQSNIAKRAIHAKSHGLLKAEFEIFDHGDTDLQHSIFKNPNTYQSIVRISNGDGPPGDDTKKLPSIGFAFKVLGVESEKFLEEQTENSIDFLLLNQPVYISKDIRDYESLMRAIDGNFGVKLIAGFKNLPGVWNRKKASPKDNPLNTFYWSDAPFRLGDVAVKYLIRPRDIKRKVANKDPDGLKKLVRERIESEDVVYDFYLQKRILDGKEDTEMPIEDYTVEWSEEKSVPVHVGVLTIPRQNLDDSFDGEGENMVFSPWNTTKDFRPLGSLNRARLVVYSFSSQKRLNLNQAQNPIA